MSNNSLIGSEFASQADRKNPTSSTEFRHDWIQGLAYEIWQERGRLLWHHDDDWAEAKRRLQEFFEREILVHDGLNFWGAISSLNYEDAMASIAQWKDQGERTPVLGQSEVPREFIRVLANEKYKQDPNQADSEANWYAAERELREVFAAVQWASLATERPGYWAAEGTSEAIMAISRYFSQGACEPVGAGTARLVVAWPNQSRTRPREQAVIMDEHPLPLERQALTARSPVAALSSEEFRSLQGNLVALLLDGPEKGRVIAVAKLDAAHPDQARQSVREQVARSPYSKRRYQLRQVLDAAVLADK